MAAALGGFSVDVETGQEANVPVILPLALLARHTRVYRVALLRWGSLLIVLIAAGWCVQRAFDMPIPIFSSVPPR